MPPSQTTQRHNEKGYTSSITQNNTVFLSAELRQVLGKLTVYIFYEVRKHGFCRTSPQMYLPKDGNKAEILYSTLLKGAALLPSHCAGQVLYTMPDYPTNLIPRPSANIIFKEISAEDNPTWQPLKDYANYKWQQAYDRQGY